MSTRLNSVRPNLLNGLFTQPVGINSGLTIIAGQNGTGKSRFLELIKQGSDALDLVNDSGEVTPLRIVAFSPKRNATKRAFKDLVNESVSQNRRLATRMQEVINAGFQDTTYSEYPSFPEMFFHSFRQNDSAGNTTHITALSKTVDEYNRIIKSVFEGIELRAEWNDVDGVPELLIKKEEIGYPIQINEVSTGEQEILSLIFNINAAANDSDLILIDEPEIHLNWGLEKKLFAYFKRFAKDKNIQIIVTTHSRIINLPLLRDLIKYFYWHEGKVKVGDQLPPSQLEAVAGEAIQFVQALPDVKKTIFVEDAMQKYFITALLKLYAKTPSDYEIVIGHDKGTVSNLFRALKQDDTLNDASLKAHFLVDGDRDTKKISNSKYFIQLDKYSIESYFFADLETLRKACGLRKPTFESRVLRSLSSYDLKGEKKYTEVFKIFLANAKLDPKIINSNIYNDIDCKPIVKALNAGNSATVDKYINNLGKAKASRIFDKKLIDFIKA